MLQYHWNSTNIITNHQANEMIKLFKKLQPKIGAIDTETNGLHIIQSTPFIYQFGFLDPDCFEGYTYLVDLERQPVLAKEVIKAWYTLASSLDKLLGHNIKFDLHMATNIGLPYLTENLSDTMFYIRYAHDALTPANGGPPLKLKEYAIQYLDHHAKHHEQLLKSERTAIAKDLNTKLKYRLKRCGQPPAKYNAKTWTLAVIENFFKDPIADYNDLPETVKNNYLEWLQQDVPIYLQNKITGIVKRDMIPYNILDRNNIYKYAHHDIIYTLETYTKLDPIIKNRKNEYGIEIEDSLILPLYEMERTGFMIDKEYLENCRIEMKQYIKKRREILYDLAGQELAIGQHELIKSILINDLGVQVNTTNADELDRLRSDLIRQGDYEGAVKFIEIVQELRTLEKWYSTYIIRFLQDLKNTDKLYTTINQVGTVSGRVVSDFQQFPKHAVKTIDGKELFHPRKMIKPSGGDYNLTVYLDYSQIELRFQAFYTILVGHPDLNLCRSYMPYQCIDSAGNEFDYSNPKHIQDWKKEWYLKETPNVLWCPTDVHTATTTYATGLKPGEPGFKDARSDIGKRTNFAKNYGAKLNKIRQMFPNKTEEEVRRIDEAYYAAFPGVKEYQQYCYDRAACSAYTVNLFGIKYYGLSGHKLINTLIQGSAAYFLKIKERQIYEYLKSKGYKTRWQMQVHDELSFTYHKEDPIEVLFELQNIMQNWEDTIVPIVADMEVTTTNWAEKKGVQTIDEIQIYLGD